MIKRKELLSKIVLVAMIVFCSLLGVYFPGFILFFKPLGDVFLYLLIVSVIPLTFFSIASSVSSLPTAQNITKLVAVLASVFIGTVLVAGLVALIVLWIFPISLNFGALKVGIPNPSNLQEGSGSFLTMTNFTEIISRRAMLPLILFSLLTGVVVRGLKKGGELFRNFLKSGSMVVKNTLRIIMKFAPVGLGVYFGGQIAQAGSNLAVSIAQVLLMSYGISLIYFCFVFTSYAYLGGRRQGVVRYWRNNLIPTMTALTSCSSIASLPANLEAAEKMSIPNHIANITMSLGAIIHKEGTAIAAIIGLFVITHGISGLDSVLLALLVATGVSIIEGSIPNGGYTGIFFIVSVYHLSIDMVPVMIIISAFLDPIATLLNVTGDTASGMLISRFMGEA